MSSGGLTVFTPPSDSESEIVARLSATESWLKDFSKLSAYNPWFDTMLNGGMTQKIAPPSAMSTTDRDAYQNPATGMTIWNTTTSKLNTFDGSAWQEIVSSVGGGGGEAPSAQTLPSFANGWAGTLSWNVWEASGIGLIEGSLDGRSASANTILTIASYLPVVNTYNLCALGSFFPYTNSNVMILSTTGALSISYASDSYYFNLWYRFTP